MFYPSLVYLNLVLGAVFGVVALTIVLRRRSAEQLHSRGLILATLAVVGVFGAWDIYATQQGHWWFSQVYTTGKTIVGVPIEEWLFFIFIPLVCLLLHQVFTARMNRPFPGLIWIAIWVTAGIVLLAAYPDRAYTLLASLAVFITAAVCVWQKLYLKADWGWFNLMVLPLFLIFNTILTALPIVLYSPDAISGIRLGSIPVEDFLFNVSMLNLAYLLLLIGRQGFNSSLAPDVTQYDRDAS